MYTELSSAADNYLLAMILLQKLLIATVVTQTDPTDPMNCSLSSDTVCFQAFGLQPLNDSLVPCYDVPGLATAVWLSWSAHGHTEFIF